jgi:hypothetical protein
MVTSDLLKKLELLKKSNRKENNGEYRHVLKKGLAKYAKIQFLQNRKKYGAFILFFSLSYFSFSVIKYYYVIYFWFMYDVDIRKPKVSDYVIERFR